MDKSEAIKIVKRYVDLVSQKYQIENVIVFGSYTKGTSHSDSDIDLAIIVKSADDIIDMQIDLMRMRKDDELMIEPHPFTLSDFHLSNPVASGIIKNGIELTNYIA